MQNPVHAPMKCSPESSDAPLSGRLIENTGFIVLSVNIFSDHFEASYSRGLERVGEMQSGAFLSLLQRGYSITSGFHWIIGFIARHLATPDNSGS